MSINCDHLTYRLVIRRTPPVLAQDSRTFGPLQVHVHCKILHQDVVGVCVINKQLIVLYSDRPSCLGTRLLHICSTCVLHIKMLLAYVLLNNSSSCTWTDPPVCVQDGHTFAGNQPLSSICALQEFTSQYCWHTL